MVNVNGPHREADDIQSRKRRMRTGCTQSFLRDYVCRGYSDKGLLDSSLRQWMDNPRHILLNKEKLKKKKRESLNLAIKRRDNNENF